MTIGSEKKWMNKRRQKAVTNRRIQLFQLEPFIYAA